MFNRLIHKRHIVCNFNLIWSNLVSTSSIFLCNVIHLWAHFFQITRYVCIAPMIKRFRFWVLFYQRQSSKVIGFLKRNFKIWIDGASVWHVYDHLVSSVRPHWSSFILFNTVLKAFAHKSCSDFIRLSLKLCNSTSDSLFWVLDSAQGWRKQWHVLSSFISD